LHKYIGGIAPDESAPGFRHIVFCPGIGAGMSSAYSAHESMYGRVSCAWNVQDDVLTLELQIPTGCTGTLHLPAEWMSVLKENGKPVCSGSTESDTSGACMTLVSGSYILIAKK
jgi:alpha-L-rhamnosidase